MVYTEYSITYYTACALSDDSNQPAHPRNPIRVFAGTLWVAKNPKLLKEDREDYGHPAQKYRRIRVIASRTCSLVGNDVPGFIFQHN